MHNRFLKMAVPVIMSVGTVAACSKADDAAKGPDAATTVAAQSADYSALARNTMQVQAGKKVFSNCAVCHSAEPGAPSPAGPALAGVLGRDIGGLADYPYSQSLAKADGTWTPEKLDAFLKNPMEAYPGTAMAFGGLAKESDRKAVIAYLAGTGSK